jgi:hypothetical protein
VLCEGGSEVPRLGQIFLIWPAREASGQAGGRVKQFPARQKAAYHIPAFAA